MYVKHLLGTDYSPRWLGYISEQNKEISFSKAYI